MPTGTVVNVVEKEGVKGKYWLISIGDKTMSTFKSDIATEAFKVVGKTVPYEWKDVVSNGKTYARLLSIGGSFPTGETGGFRAMAPRTAESIEMQVLLKEAVETLRVSGIKVDSATAAAKLVTDVWAEIARYRIVAKAIEEEPPQSE